MALLLTVSLCGCKAKDPSNNADPTSSTAPHATTEEIFARSKAHAYFTADETPENEKQKAARAAFDAFLQENFVEYANASGILNVHFLLRRPEDYGVTNVKPTIGSLVQTSISGDAFEEALKELSAFSYEDLTHKQQLAYDILNYYMQAQADMVPFMYYAEPLSTSGGLHSTIPIYLAEYTFTRAQDVEDYLALMHSLPDTTDELIAYEQKRVELGIFMSKDALDTVIKQAREIISDTPEDIFLNETFANLLKNAGCFSESEIADYTARHKKELENSFYPAYDRLISALDGMRSSCKDIGGAVNLPNGEAYVNALCRSYLLTDRSLADIKTSLEASNSLLRSKMQTLATLDPKAATAASSFKQPSKDPAGILNHLMTYYADRFPSLGDCDYTVNYVPKGLEKSVSPAFYLLPPLDDYKNNSIYINNDSINNNGLFTTLAHEGYPGHMLQSTYYNSTEPYPLLSFLTFLPYVEGWASYVERLSFEAIDGIESSTAKMLSINSLLSLNSLALIDIGLNYEGWTFNEYANYMTINFNISPTSDPELLQEFYLNMTSSPLNYLPYALGYMEVERLLDQQETALGEDFDLYQFHDAFLHIGPAPFSIVEKYLNKIR